MDPDTKPSNDASKAALSEKETALRVEQEKRLQDVKAEAAAKPSSTAQPKDHLNPDG